MDGYSKVRLKEAETLKEVITRWRIFMDKKKGLRKHIDDFFQRVEKNGENRYEISYPKYSDRLGYLFSQIDGIPT